ncbi:C4-dicarboxylate ABC transporter permease [Bacillus timonensis]|uniref:C4-dicarboxylate ABC transporter permease n=1 Tax=Bacillus timonensis TaxID=1033734 RepID=A0A4S3PM25_9BACI|nr:tripartite tricarboxylate transporter permease [Bacillus timonensis]THE10519.1 C4-dicarboxylate ABC transporter permease [Bacillus timonensis]
MLEALLIPLLDIKLLLLVVFGTLFGFIIGALPGLSVTMAVTLLVSLTFTWDSTAAIVVMISVFFGGVYGGSRTAILLNIPGTASSFVQTFDGYPLTKRGEAGRAIGISTIVSIIGGLIGLIVLIIASPLLTNLALGFAPRDYFLIMLLGILLVGSLASDYLPKAIFVAGIGIFIGLVGIDPMSGVGRFTFGNLQLMGGINYIACLLGLFGLAEVLVQLHNLGRSKADVIIKNVIPPLVTILKYLPLTLRTAVIGVVVGALPGAGGEIASLLAYDHAKRTTKNPTRPFGKGAYEGLIAPETAVMSCVGGALIPMLTLGIPGDAVTAVLIGGLLIHGMNPGPMLLINTPDIFWIIVSTSAISLVFVGVWGLSGIRLFARIISVPKYILLPIVTFFTVIGSYGIQNSVSDVYWMIAFGIIGYFMRIFNFPAGPLVLGIILGPMMDNHLRRALISEEGNVFNFLISLFTHPISLVLSLIVIFTLFSQTKVYHSLKVKFSRGTAA